ncbi:hypothetical protein PYW07_009843 [Mythimna separata]|uniref:Cytochrome P450 n=1 Tax=Mythimna separata TaxID=271217 RepID=A0AAD7YGE8_MYTSE|nr:hypothetical protein PYW07_009843 [Mythimna separata]
MFAVVLLCIACFAYWCWCRQRAKTAEPPSLPGAWPLVGHLPLFFGDGCKLWNQMNNATDQCSDVGGAAKINFGPITIYVITDPDDCNTIATTCMEKDPIYEFIKPWIGESLIASKYEVWKNDYKLLTPAFSQIILNTYLDVFNSQSMKLVKDLEKYAGNGPFDLFTYLQHNALNTLCLTALGEGFTDSNLASDYLHAVKSTFDTLVERVIKIWWHNPYTFAWSKLKKEQDGTKVKPFVDILLELSVEKGAFNDEQIRAQVDLMLGAGQESTPNAVLFTMVLLGSHPDVQERVFSEIQEVLGEDRDVEKMDLSRLQYLEAVVKESLRLFPIAPLIGRKLERDVKLKNFTLSAGKHCALLLCGLHKNSIWGPDRCEFKPERWLEPSKVPAHLVYAPFGLGRRQCIGKTFAMMSMKTTLAHVVRSYRIKADHTKMRLKYVATLKPDNEGRYISIEKRTR